MKIHPTAIVSKNVEIDPSTYIGPYVIIEKNVKIGKNNKIMAHAFIGEGTIIGDNNEIHMGAIVGHVPQDKKYKGDKSFLKIGNNNIIREYVTIHRGSFKESITIIKNNCLIMGGVHIAHDCEIGNNVIIANMAGMAGHVIVGDRAFISGGTMIHQFVNVGKLAIIAGNARISMDVPPFVIAAERNQVWGINVIGLRRAGYSTDTINELKEFYRLFFKDPAPRGEVINKIKKRNFKSKEIQFFISFIENSKRGICYTKINNCDSF